MRDVLERATDYQRTYAIVGRGHYLAAERLARLNRWLGIPVVVITAVVGTTIFGTINQQNVPTHWKILAGMVSLTGAVLSSLQTSLGFAQTAERHKAVASRYRAIKRRLELFALKYSGAESNQRAVAIADLENLNKELTELASESPNLPDICYDRAVREYDLDQGKFSRAVLESAPNAVGRADG
jgi:hypothetical protein